MLDHPNIIVELNVDALDRIKMKEDTREILYEGQVVDCVIYTGAIDEFFHKKYGALPYRSLDIRYESFRKDSILPSEIVS